MSWELTTEVSVTRFDKDGVMMRSSKDDRSWCESCLVGDFTNCVKEVEWRSSASPLSIMSGEVPGKLKSPHIIRRSTASVPRLVTSPSTGAWTNADSCAWMKPRKWPDEWPNSRNAHYKRAWKRTIKRTGKLNTTDYATSPKGCILLITNPGIIQDKNETEYTKIPTTV